jgi:hypothetical protein
MKSKVTLLIVFLLSGCSKSYSDLESAFEVEKLTVSPSLEAHTITITSLQHKGAESYYDIATIYTHPNSIDIKIDAPFTKPISIPSNEIAGCSMTCFGTDDQHVDLLIPKTGSDVMIPSSKKLLDWCWDNKRPMLPSSARRDWQYNGIPLPSPKNFQAQLESRELFDKQTVQSCLGY